MKQIKTRREIDELCESIVQKYEGENYIEKPVDIAGLALGFFKLKVFYVRFPTEKQDRLGCLTDGKSIYKLIRNGMIGGYSFPKNTILLDISLKGDSEKAKRRFTLAHELYHYIDSVINGNSSYGFNSRVHGDEQYNKAELCEMMSLDEWAADRGAAALLMPRQLVCATSKLMFGSKEIPIFGNNILMNDDKQRIIEMADYLGVSFTSLLIRMKELKLFKYHSMDQYISLTMGDMEQAVVF